MTTNSRYKQLAIRKEDKEFRIKSTDKETLRKWFYLLTLGRKLDEKAPNYLKQALGWSYHAPYAGHDGIQLAIGQVFDLFLRHFGRKILGLQIADRLQDHLGDVFPADGFQRPAVLLFHLDDLFQGWPNDEAVLSREQLFQKGEGTVFRIDGKGQDGAERGQIHGLSSLRTSG